MFLLQDQMRDELDCEPSIFRKQRRLQIQNGTTNNLKKRLIFSYFKINSS